MDTTLLHRIFEHSGFGCATLAENWRIVAANKRFSQFSVGPGNPEDVPIQTLFPETFGLDVVFKQLKSGERRLFKLENLNRDSGNQELTYFSMSFFSTDNEENPILCIIEDATPRAVLDQRIYQQRNEIRLLESLLGTTGSSIATSILGQSEPINAVRQTIEKMSKIPSANILLTGESGTGKSMIARVIHRSSQGDGHPFVEINCAAIPETLLESELFGYEKGAFTNATNTKRGLLEEADNGTLFLDEIGELPLKLQAKLLSFLETKRFRRLGSTAELSVKLRLITASNRSLPNMVTEGNFREDLFYRLNVVKIELPNLRGLGQDILIIAANFINVFNRDFNKSIEGVTPEAAQKLLGYSWPGNIRELRNAIERAMIFAEGETIDAEDLQLGTLQLSKRSLSPLDSFDLPPEGLSFINLEKKILQQAMDMCSGNQSRAAQLLQLSRDTFRYRLEKYDLL